MATTGFGNPATMPSLLRDSASRVRRFRIATHISPPFTVRPTQRTATPALACTANIGQHPAAARALLCKQQEEIPETITQGIVSEEIACFYRPALIIGRCLWLQFIDKSKCDMKQLCKEAAWKEYDGGLTYKFIMGAVKENLQQMCIDRGAQATNVEFE